MRDDALEARFREWASEYRGGKYEDIGFPRKNMLAVLIEHRGFFPDGQMAKRIPVRSPADDVEEAVQALQGVSQRAAMALRVEYLSAYLPLEDRLRKMARLKMRMSEDLYFELICFAREYVGAALDAKRKRAAA